jgi:hypothetical protein
MDDAPPLSYNEHCARAMPATSQLPVRKEIAPRRPRRSSRQAGHGGNRQAGYGGNRQAGHGGNRQAGHGGNRQAGYGGNRQAGHGTPGGLGRAGSVEPAFVSGGAVVALS